MAGWLGVGGEQREEAEEGGELCKRTGRRQGKVGNEVRERALGEGGLS